MTMPKLMQINYKCLFARENATAALEQWREPQVPVKLSKVSLAESRVIVRFATRKTGNGTFHFWIKSFSATDEVEIVFDVQDKPVSSTEHPVQEICQEHKQF
jgi:hypothetical protein